MSIFKKYSNYEQNHGVSGVVYILTNPGLRDGYLKIGCSRYSGKKRADDLNLTANTGTPGLFKCIYEKKTQDCGRAEQEVFKVLAKYRRGKKYQEFFEAPFDLAKKIIDEVCDAIDGRPLKIVNSASDTENKSKSFLREALGYFLIFAIGLAMLWGFLNFISYKEPINISNNYVNSKIHEPAQSTESKITNFLPQEQVNADIERYSSLISKAIGLNKQYPEIAQMQRLQGTVILDLEINSNGLISSVRIKRSSRHEILDKEALEMINNASPFPVPPKSLQGKNFNVLVPISFKLE